MNIQKTVEGKAVTLVPEGRIDTLTAPDFRQAVAESIEGMDALVIDCSELKYISSAGLRVLMSAHKSMLQKDGMKIVNVRPMILEVFEATGLDEVFDIE